MVQAMVEQLRHIRAQNHYIDDIRHFQEQRDSEDDQEKLPYRKPLTPLIP